MSRLTDIQYIEQELLQCKQDIDYCCKKYVYIEDRDNQTVLYRRNPSQLAFSLALRQAATVYVLKARKLGFSTEALIQNWHLVHFNKGHHGVVFAQTQVAALGLLRKILRVYDNLPEWMRVGEFGLKHRDETGGFIEWNHGGTIRALTAESDSIRSSDADFLHFSEFSAYKNPEQLLTSVVDAKRAGAIVIYETTARGLGYAHNCWVSDNGWAKLFFPWTAEPKYVISRKDFEREIIITEEMKGGEKRVRGAIDSDMPPEFTRVCQKHGLTVPQMRFYFARWMERNKDWHSLHQEWPLTAELAFQVAEGRVFQVVYANTSQRPGIETFEKPQSMSVYTMGVDTASGSRDGDFSAFAILDVTEPKFPRIARTYYGHVDTVDFAQLVLKSAQEYSALVCGERNTYGLDVLQRLRDANYHLLYRETRPQKKGIDLADALGFYTSQATRPLLIGELKWAFGGPKTHVAVPCRRLQGEINDFMYHPDSGKEEHAPSCHDDLLFAVGLALYARRQVIPHKQVDMRRAPETPAEKRRFRLMFNRPWEEGDRYESMDPEEQAFFDEMFPQEGHGIKGIHFMARDVRKQRLLGTAQNLLDN